MDPKLLREIEAYVREQNVYSASMIRAMLDNKVKALCPENPPSKTNTRFHPTLGAIRNKVSREIMRLNVSRVDQDALSILTEEIAKSDCNIFYRQNSEKG